MRYENACPFVRKYAKLDKMSQVQSEMMHLQNKVQLIANDGEFYFDHIYYILCIFPYLYSVIYYKECRKPFQHKIEPIISRPSATTLSSHA
jgi:uncharacterized membrane protein (DUF106 family)